MFLKSLNNSEPDVTLNFSKIPPPPECRSNHTQQAIVDQVFSIFHFLNRGLLTFCPPWVVKCIFQHFSLILSFLEHFDGK